VCVVVVFFCLPFGNEHQKPVHFVHSSIPALSFGQSSKRTKSKAVAVPDRTMKEQAYRAGSLLQKQKQKKTRLRPVLKRNLKATDSVQDRR